MYKVLLDKAINVGKAEYKIPTTNTKTKIAIIIRDFFIFILLVKQEINQNIGLSVFVMT